jgi:LPS O-antigen subunit length determinant protein (WzzB/FepE family)
MSKTSLGLSDLSIAPRKPERQTEAAPDPITNAPAPIAKVAAAVLPRPNENLRRETAEARAIAQEDLRYSLKNLKRSKQRNVKFFINIALDYALKARLQRAAAENDLKMTAVVKAALDYYLTENNY